MNNIVIVIVGVVSLGVGMMLSQKFPQLRSCCALAAVQGRSAQGVEVGNKICPVSGRPIGEMGPGYQEKYKGKIYTLCCGGCIGRFERDPERYSKIANDEVKGQVQ